MHFWSSCHRHIICNCIQFISLMAKRNLRKYFEDGWNKIFGKEEDKSKLRTQSLYRAQKGILNVGTPHDWEDYKKYKEQENESD